MTNIIALPPRRRGHRLRLLIDGQVSEQPSDAEWHEEIRDYRRCIERAQANIKRAIASLNLDTVLIAGWEAKIAEIELKLGQERVVIEFTRHGEEN
jgi:hypothetical protein